MKKLLNNSNPLVEGFSCLIQTMIVILKNSIQYLITFPYLDGNKIPSLAKIFMVFVSNKKHEKQKYHIIRSNY